MQEGTRRRAVVALRAVLLVALMLLPVSLTACSTTEAANDGGAPPTNALCTAELPPECQKPEAEVSAEHPLDSQVTTCRVIRAAGVYRNEYVNILAGGSLYFLEDAK